MKRFHHVCIKNSNVIRHLTTSSSSVEKKPNFRAGAMIKDGPRVNKLKEQEIIDRNSGKRPSFHTRDFPSCLVDYRSQEGKDALLRSLNNGTAEQYLNLTASYQMQSGKRS